MKTKNNLIKIEFLILLILIAIPFAVCVDFDGDGIDDGEQNLCGDGFCQSEETATSCPADCSGVSPGEPSLATQELQSQEELPAEQNDSAVNQENVSSDNPPTNEVENTSLGEPINSLEESSENSFFSKPIFKIISGIIGLIVIAIIIFVLIKKKKPAESDENETNSNPYPPLVPSSPPSLDSLPKTETSSKNLPDLSYSPLPDKPNSQ